MRKFPLLHSIQGGGLVTQQVLSLLHEHSFYVELFLSGNSVFLKKPKVIDNWLNDTDSKFILTLSYIRNCPNEFINELARIAPIAQDSSALDLYLYRAGDFGSAVVWFYENKIALAQEQKFNLLQWSKHIRELSEALEGVLLTCYPYERILWALPKESLVYIDPVVEFNLGNTTQDEYMEKHRVLSTILQECSFRLSFVLRCENTEELKALYTWVNEQEEKKHRGFIEDDEMLFICG